MHAHTNARLTLCRGDTHFLILTEPIQPSFEFSSCVRAELILSTLPAVVNWCPKRCVCFLSSRHSAALGLRCSLHHCHCPLCADYPSTVRQATTAPARARTHTHTHTHTHTRSAHLPHTLGRCRPPPRSISCEQSGTTRRSSPRYLVAHMW
jgi:hypothetical protein